MIPLSALIRASIRDIGPAWSWLLFSFFLSMSVCLWINDEGRDGGLSDRVLCPCHAYDAGHAHTSQ